YFAILILIRDCAYAPNSRPGRTNIQKIGSPNISRSLERGGARGKGSSSFGLDTPQPVDQRPKIDPSVAAAPHFDTEESRPQAEGVAPPRKSTVGRLAGCCGRAASGHATAAPLSLAKNFRRAM